MKSSRFNPSMMQRSCISKPHENCVRINFNIVLVDVNRVQNTDELEVFVGKFAWKSVATGVCLGSLLALAGVKFEKSLLTAQEHIPPIIPHAATPAATFASLKLASTPQPNQVLETALTGFSRQDDMEPWVAANPLNPLNFVVAGISWSTGQSILAAATLDGGKTWHRSILPRALDAVFHADPAVVFAADGVAHLVNIPVYVSDNSGVPLGIEVSRSLDGGLSWSTPHRISANRGKDDKTAITTDTMPDSPYFGRIYLAWKWPGGGIYMARSDDSGQSYSAPFKVSNDAVSGLSLATLTDGTVLLAANRGAGAERGIVVYRSSNGGASFAAGVRVATTRAQWYVQVPANCNVGALIQTSLAVSTSSGTDDVALLWDDYQPGSPSSCPDACQSSTACRSRSYIARSSSGGKTWLNKKQVTPAGFASGDQFFSWLGAGYPAGTLFVAQRSSHEDTARREAHTWLLRSDDGGASWRSLARLSSASTSAGRLFQGDYLGVAASPAAVVAAWTDLRFSTTELYVAALNGLSAAAITPAFSGAWYDPAQNGHGFLLQVLDDGSVLVYWFTFDNMGRAAWLFGIGQIKGNYISTDLFYEPDGPRFPPDFDPADFQPKPWGSLEIEFADCDNGYAEWTSNASEFLSGSMDLTRLTNTASLDCEEE